MPRKPISFPTSPRKYTTAINPPYIQLSYKDWERRSLTSTLGCECPLPQHTYVPSSSCIQTGSQSVHPGTSYDWWTSLKTVSRLLNFEPRRRARHGRNRVGRYEAGQDARAAFQKVARYLEPGEAAPFQARSRLSSVGWLHFTTSTRRASMTGSSTAGKRQ